MASLELAEFLAQSVSIGLRDYRVLFDVVECTSRRFALSLLLEEGVVEAEAHIL